MSALKERAQAWLDAYKRGEIVVNEFSFEDLATIISEYLHGTEENILEKSKELKNENDQLREMHDKAIKELGELKTELRTSELTRESLARELTEARGKIKAYEFVIRCNGVSGAEV